MIAASRLLGRLRQGSPQPLALLRVVVGLVVLFSSEPQMALDLARGSPDLWFPPQGLHWLRPLFSLLAPHLSLVVMVLRASAILTVIGLWTRWSLLVLIGSFVVLFGGAQFTGTVLHDMHLLWFLLLLWVSPCDQAWSLDGWQRDQPRVGHASREAGLTVAFARVLLGLVYFFPGLHKLWASGLEWAFSDNLRNQLHLKWFEAGGRVPWPRVDQFTDLLQVGAAAVMLFETSFLMLIFFRRGRWLAGVSGLLFHAVTQYFLYIPFAGLWLTYVVLLDFPARQRSSEANGAVSSPPFRLLGVTAVGTALVLAVTVQGVRGDMQSWPFACYPTFEQIAADRIVDLAVEVTRSDGTTELLREPADRPQHAWGTVWRLAGLYGDAPSPARLRAFADEVARHNQTAPLDGGQLRYYAETYAIAPEAYGEPPLSRVLLHDGATRVP